MNLNWVDDAQLDAYYRMQEELDRAVCDHIGLMEDEYAYFAQFSGENFEIPSIDMGEAYADMERRRGY